MRTPYGARDAQRWMYAHPSWYARQGFAVAIVDVRGRWSSEGAFDPFRHEAADGEDTVEWVAAQPWCNGRVGMYGMSYPGAAQLLAASRRPAALAAIAPGMTQVGFGDGWTYVGGALNLAFVLSWAPVLGIDAARRAGDLEALAAFEALAGTPGALYDRYDTVPLDDLLPAELWAYLPYLRDWLSHPSDDAYWEQLAGADLLDAVDVPALHVGGWYDVFLAGTLRSYRRLLDRGRAPQHLVLGPWAHCPWAATVGDRDFGPSAAGVVDELQLRFFGHWLHGHPLELPAVRAFVLNENRWVDEDAWPPRRMREQHLYLTSGGRANSSSGDGRLVAAPEDGGGPDVIVSDPRAPLVSTGGHSCCFEAVAPIGPRDQRGQEAWNDLLVYESPALAADLVLAGEVAASLAVGFSGDSADFVVRLVDVQPCGASYNLVDSVVRLDHRRSRRGGRGARRHLRAAPPGSPAAARDRRLELPGLRPQLERPPAEQRADGLPRGDLGPVRLARPRAALVALPPGRGGTAVSLPAPRRDVQTATFVAFTEGPAVDEAGNVYFSDIRNNRILRLDPAGQLETFREPSGRANGHVFDANGVLYHCEGSEFGPAGGRRITRTDLRTGAYEVVTDTVDGVRYNGPNDICVDGLGRLYFSDPSYYDRSAMELDVEGVYRIDPDGTVTRILDQRHVQRPNGVAVTQDSRLLYVVDSCPGRHQRIVRFELDGEGRPGPGSLFHDFAPGRGGDGIELDLDGNLYVAAGIHHPRNETETDLYPAGIYVLSPAGELVHWHAVPEDVVTNVAFGGPDGRTLYITAGKSLFTTRVDVPGQVAYPRWRPA